MPWVATPFTGQSCELSPFRPNLLAVATAQYYGITGGGQLHVFDIAGPDATIVPVCDWTTHDGMYDCAWSEASEHVVVTAQGDGTVKFFDKTRRGEPVMSLAAHTADVCGVDWNCNASNLVCSASWDNTIKVWDVLQGKCTSTFASHKQVAYAAIWSPARPMCLASVAGDHMLNIQDVKAGDAPVQSIKAHQAEVLTVDWSKYNESVVVTGGVDRTLRVFDLRNSSAPVQVLHGHCLAVRRVKAHPHCGNQLVSASYDMSVNMWDLNLGQMIQHFEHHNEFVLGVDLSLFEENLLVTTAWDQTVCAWNCVQIPPPSLPRGRDGADGGA